MRQTTLSSFLMRALVLAALALSPAGCGDDGGTPPPGSGDDAGQPADAGPADAAADAGEDAGQDAGEDAGSDDDAGTDTDAAVL
ncbi:hypothetical protein [Haliangium ochraceum]|nr:hypothetical protein [Haliangium ochraceum]